MSNAKYQNLAGVSDDEGEPSPSGGLVPNTQPTKAIRRKQAPAVKIPISRAQITVSSPVAVSSPATTPLNTKTSGATTPHPVAASPLVQSPIGQANNVASKPSPMDSKSSVTYQPLKRYVVRGIMSVTIPLALILYYVLTYLRWLRYPEDDGGGWVVQGYLDNAEVVNYSWFILGTFALNLGTYAIGGSVASMVTGRFWKPKNARRLLDLGANSFADVSSWAKIPASMIKNRDIRGSNNGLLWNILAIINIVGFFAWPLTGLTMQTEDGFALEMQGGWKGSGVIGHNLTSFFSRDPLYVRKFSENRILSGANPQLPRGQFYIEEGSSIDQNLTTSNQLPETANESIFLTVQADGPIVGDRLFGLVLRYNCSVATSLKNFTILSKRKKNTRVSFQDEGIIYPVGDADTGSAIFVFQAEDDFTGLTDSLVRPSMEVGISIPFDNLTGQNQYDDIQDSGGYIAGSNYTTTGIDSPVFIEVVLWQATRTQVSPDESANFTETENGIPELEGLYQYDNPNPEAIKKAVGCRCQAISALGYANVDGRTGRFVNFEAIEEVPTAINTFPNPNVIYGFERFETSIIRSLTFNDKETFITADTGTYPTTFGLEWYLNLWRATGLLRRYTVQTDQGLRAAGVIQADQLKEIMIRLYQNYAVTLMYDGASPSDDLVWNHPNITVASRSKILVPGAVPPEVVLGMLLFWGMSIILLALLYQFRMRWMERLDNVQMFKLGVTRPDGVTPESFSGKNGKKVLEKLPGTAVR